MSTTVSTTPARRWRVVGIVAAFALALAFIVLAVLVAVETVARQQVPTQIEERVRAALNIDDSVDVVVTVSTDQPLLWQFTTGSLDEVTIDVARFASGPLVGKLEIEARGVPLDENAPVRELRAEVRVAEDDIAALAPNLSGADATTLTLDAPEIVVGTEFTIFGFSVPWEIGITPGADEGAVTFAVTSLRFGGQELSLAELSRLPLFSGLVDVIGAQQDVCVASSLPSGVSVSAVDVVGSELVVRITGDGIVLASAGELGRCD